MLSRIYLLSQTMGTPSFFGKKEVPVASALQAIATTPSLSTRLGDLAGRIKQTFTRSLPALLSKFFSRESATPPPAAPIAHSVAVTAPILPAAPSFDPSTASLFSLIDQVRTHRHRGEEHTPPIKQEFEKRKQAQEASLQKKLADYRSTGEALDKVKELETKKTSCLASINHTHQEKAALERLLLSPEMKEGHEIHLEHLQREKQKLAEAISATEKKLEDAQKQPVSSSRNPFKRKSTENPEVDSLKALLASHVAAQGVIEGEIETEKAFLDAHNNTSQQITRLTETLPSLNEELTRLLSEIANANKPQLESELASSEETIEKDLLDYYAIQAAESSAFGAIYAKGSAGYLLPLDVWEPEASSLSLPDAFKTIRLKNAEFTTIQKQII